MSCRSSEGGCSSYQAEDWGNSCDSAEDQLEAGAPSTGPAPAEVYVSAALAETEGHGGGQEQGGRTCCVNRAEEGTCSCTVKGGEEETGRGASLDAADPNFPGASSCRDLPGPAFLFSSLFPYRRPPMINDF